MAVRNHAWILNNPFHISSPGSDSDANSFSSHQEAPQTVLAVAAEAEAEAVDTARATKSHSAAALASGFQPR